MSKAFFNKHQRQLLFLTGVAIIIGTFLYFYQTPIINENEAISSATGILQNPPLEWNFENIDVENLQEGEIEGYLIPRTDGFFNKLFNKQQWAINVNSQEMGVLFF
ncbi:hypothetical protein [Lysinibacillus telephonicus]|uniref:Uncharacterized protein n=1 Tax=Lysinibacillus telephonicus TaxID=1714840 RepID=A0A3S0JKF2_9BACI|nr:hypothetical protein [Lysinibacillus telephonicus]RTQ87804.1 hypothetical protein EKG35_18575 [Lysinibacillus telephonicus]